MVKRLLSPDYSIAAQLAALCDPHMNLVTTIQAGVVAIAQALDSTRRLTLTISLGLSLPGEIVWAVASR